MSKEPKETRRKIREMFYMHFSNDIVSLMVQETSCAAKELIRTTLEAFKKNEWEEKEILDWTRNRYARDQTRN